MDWWKVAIGACIVLFTWREIFQDLFHPSQSGALSEWVGRAFFRLLRPWPKLLASAGPLTVVSVIACWTGLIVVGMP